ncbi:class E sortase [Kitasatospora sp. NBC_00374]|uniref:class E sortase n=1 Tax=Kitasatospora sp. NBC_00374 TaxID=2975964 RepID=UPI0030E0C109
MTAVRPEGNTQRPGDGGDEAPGTGDWGVYEQAGGPGAASPFDRLPASEQTMKLRVVPAADAAADPDAAGGRPARRAEGRTALRSGTGRRRASGPRRGPRQRPKESKLVVAARMVGELFITLGLVMLLFVSYQLWWTNVQADAAADGTRNQLEQQWAQPQQSPAPGVEVPKEPGKFEPGQGFAIVYIPKLGLKYPIAEGTNKQQVLDKGLVGHYTGTAMPADKAGNFAIAAHRTTHGQPFRKIGELKPGDKIVVETSTTFYTYEVAGGIPETPPNNVSVIQPVPKGSPFTQAGRYITLTTCTPEFSARGRLIVFGKLAGEQPRAQGQPAALAGN